MLADLWTDLRTTARALRANPGFAAAAIGSLALGLGLNILLFSVVDRLLWKPLPVSRPEELVAIFNQTERQSQDVPSSYLDYLDLRDQSEVFSSVIGHSMMMASISPDERPELAVGEIVTGNYFESLGIRPLLGRLLSPEDDRQGAAPALVLGESYFVRRFGRDATVIGRTVKMRGTPYNIVGVVPASFPGLMPGFAADLWVPVARLDDVAPAGWLDSTGPPTSAPRLEQRGFRWMMVKGRLRPGIGFEAARASVDALTQRLAQTYPETNANRRAHVLPASRVRLHPSIDGALGPAGVALLAMVAVVLLVACANVANMILARATGRRREIGIRLAIGAGPGRLVRQLMSESLVLSLAGGALGLVIAAWGAGALAAMKLPLQVTLDLGLQLNGRMIVFCLIAVVATAVLFGLLPALRSVRPELVSSLKGDDSISPAGVARFGMRNLLVVGQLAASFVLLVGAGLLLKSVTTSLSADLGFASEGVTVATYDLDSLRFSRDQSLAFNLGLLERLRALPEVESAAVASRIPLTVNIHNENLYLDGQDLGGDEGGLAVDVTRVSPGYLQLLRVPLLAGRDFDSSHARGTPGVAIVSRAAAERLWPGRSAIGEHFRTDPDGPLIEVIGVSADYKVRSTGEAPRPMVHFAYAQRPAFGTTVLIRSRAEGADLRRVLDRELGALAPDLLLFENHSMAEVVALNVLPARLGASVFGGFGLLALLLAAIGLYGVVAFATRQRTREIGIRMAIGAERGAVMTMVLRQGARLVAVGLAIGLALALALTMALSKVFAGLGPAEPLVYLVAALGLTSVALLANLIPARRAARLDPLAALRQG